MIAGDRGQLDPHLLAIDQLRRRPHRGPPFFDPLDPDMRYTEAESHNRPPQGQSMPQSNQTPSPIQRTLQGIAAEQRLKKMAGPVKIAFWSMVITCALRFGMLAMAIEGFVYDLAVVASGITLTVAPALELRRMWFKHKTRAIRNECRKCDYDLTGLYNGDRCPECGTTIDRPPGSNVR